MKYEAAYNELLEHVLGVQNAIADWQDSVRKHAIEIFLSVSVPHGFHYRNNAMNGIADTTVNLTYIKL